MNLHSDPESITLPDNLPRRPAPTAGRRERIALGAAVGVSVLHVIS
jgi:hypothetical protein